MKHITGSQAVIESLLQENVQVIFGYPGGAIIPVYDALYDYREQMRHILVRHEQGAAHAAEGYARMTGKPGVCLATSGPGATNLLTGIADAMLDSVPLVCIVGQVPTALLGSNAFQEADIMGMSAPITKWNYQITDADEIPQILAKAFYIATSGRPGPVLIEITKDAQLAECTSSYAKVTKLNHYHPTTEPDTTQIQAAAELLNAAKKPYLLIGHGIRISKAENELLSFVEKTGIPVATTLHGLSAFPSKHPLYAGMLGMHGNYAANHLTNEADVILAIGMRFDDRVTGNLERYAKQANIIHIDINPVEHNKNVPVTIAIAADAKKALKALHQYVKQATHPKWLALFDELMAQEQHKVIRPETKPRNGPLTMPEVVHLVSEKTAGQAVIVSDVGQHQMVSARYYAFEQPNSYITSGGLGTMGFALPAALGAKIAVPDREVIALIGDGSIQMTIQELATVAQERLSVKIIIINNSSLGMVRQWQQLFFNERYSYVQLQNPDFITIAKGYGIEGERVEERNNVDKAITRLLASKGPRILEVIVRQDYNVFPMIPTGAGVDQMRLE